MDDIAWKIIDKYFKDNTHCLVRHHLETYDDFFRRRHTKHISREESRPHNETAGP